METTNKINLIGEEKSDRRYVDVQPASVYDQLSLLSRCLYRFVWPLASKARSEANKLKPSDFDNQAPSDCLAEYARLKLESNWRRELMKSRSVGARASMLRAIVQTFGLTLAGIILIDILAECVCEPAYFYICIRMIDCIGAYLAARQLAEVQSTDYGGGENSTSDDFIELSDLEPLKWNIIWTSILFAISMVLTALLMHPFFWLAGKLALKMRAALARMIYEKSLRIDKTRANCGASVSYKQAMSLISRDIDMLDTNIQTLSWILVGPGESLVLTLVLSQTLGYKTTAVSFIINAAIAFQRGYMNIQVAKHTRAASKLADERVSISSEAFYASRMLRMCGWTRRMLDRIEDARNREVKERSYQIFLATVVDTTVFFSGCTAVAIATLLFGHYYADLEINQANVSSIFLVTGIYRRTISRYLPQGILAFINLSIVFDRIGGYLAADEIGDSDNEEKKRSTKEKDKSSHNSIDFSRNFAAHEWKPVEARKSNRSLPESDDGLQFVALAKPIRRLQLDQVIAGWLPNDACLNGINLCANSNELLIVAGRVGAGKSSLLQVILGELPVSSGNIYKSGKVAYASQEAWIFSATIRENILMDEPLEVGRYMEVLRVCSLLADLQAFPARDRTIIGDRGVTLSGGQKARINLARCLYQQADIYLLDDPLSAVDAHVAQHIFSEAIKRYLGNKCTILVTHQLQFLSQADRILILDELPAGYDGFHSVSGTYSELARTDALQTLTALPEESLEAVERTIKTQSPASMYEKFKPIECDITAKLKEKQVDRVHEIEAEIIRTSRQRPQVWRSMRFYVSNCTSPLGFFVFVALNYGIRFTFLGCSLWLNYWSGVQHLSINKDSSWLAAEVSLMPLEEALWVLLVIWICLTFMAFYRNSLYYTSVLSGAKRIHSQLIGSILRTKMSFFDVTPLGDLISRISADLSYMDTVHVPSCDDISLTASSISVMLFLACASEPILFVALLPIIVIVYVLFNYLVRVMSVVKRIDGARRSQVYTHTGITLDGLATIRACGKQQTFLDKFNHALDRHSSIWFVNLGLRRLLINGFDYLLIAFYLILVVVIVVDTIHGGGSYAFVALFMLQLMTRVCQAIFTEIIKVYTSIQSIDRIRQYHNLEPEEKSLAIAGATDWGMEMVTKAEFVRGQVEFIGVSLKYAHSSEIVLRDLTFSINASEKIGIVGRTGAGKSSIVAILFRLYHFEGFVKIDGQDTKQLDLESARQSISIIPQDPVLFSGSLRVNMDPLDEHGDEELWRALEAVQLDRLIHASNQALDMQVTDGGANFSVGQRQLVCLARAILKRNKLLVLDEATANVDPETDGLIQRAIRQEFAGCTVLTVAHRLNTIADSDRIMVMDAGRLAEFDTPIKLLEKGGLFADMIARCGSQAEELRDKIRRAKS